jgi:alkylhydroperoxidase family enzyme
VVDEDEADLVWDGYDEGRLDARSVAGLRLADAVVFDPQSLTPEVREDLLREFGAEGIAELALSVGMFMSMSKVLIAFGLEPVEMETTVMHAPVIAAEGAE